MRGFRFGLILYRGLGIGIAIGLMEVFARLAGDPYAQVPFVTSIVLALGLPDTPGAAPRAIILGHVLSTLAGLGVNYLVGTGDLSSAYAAALAGILMAAAGAMHPPAGLDAFLTTTQTLPALWLFTTVLPGAVMLAVFSVIWSRVGNMLFEVPPKRFEARPTRTGD